MDSTHDSDKRSLVRRHLLVYLEVVDSDTGSSLGRIGDLNRSGFLLLSTIPFDPGLAISAGINLPKQMDFSMTRLDLTFRVRWCRRDARPGSWICGCELFNTDSDALDIIDTLVGRLGFSDGTRRIFLKNDQNIFLDTDIPTGE